MPGHGRSVRTRDLYGQVIRGIRPSWTELQQDLGGAGHALGAGPGVAGHRIGLRALREGEGHEARGQQGQNRGQDQQDGPDLLRVR
ncbi:hypothetical protein ACFFX0_27185 [Citricoccus parietis]|uniref:Uncharacterized protein n=1 Tax=Citricoccus parietis TaxID=592307 RepID=A0ABV5G6V0_9MICC